LRRPRRSVKANFCVSHDLQVCQDRTLRVCLTAPVILVPIGARGLSGSIMAKDDVLDLARARFYLWGARGIADEGAAPEARNPSSINAALQVREFAARVHRVWAMSDRGLQARATIGLAEHAERLALDLAALPPRAAVHLLRLIARYRLLLEPELYERLPGALMWCSLEAPEFVDLLVEVAETGDSRLELLINLGMGREHSTWPGLGLRLLPILRAQGRYRERALAATFADGAEDWPIVVPELRRALGEPYLRLRLAALQGLLARGGLQPDDVQALLDDLVAHPPPDYTSALREACHEYARALHEAVVKLKPPGGYRPLEAIAHHECAFVHGWREIGESFALAALAAAYPERAVEEIDCRLESSVFWDRRCALMAANQLSDELARPRLYRGAGDPDARVHEYAREVCLKRFGQRARAVGQVPLELERETPSPSLGSRLTVLRGSDQDARLGMVKALLAAAPEREALALLLYQLRDHNLWLGVRELGLPQSCENWAKELCGRFGEPAFEGLLLLAERQAAVGVENGWLSALAALPAQGFLSEGQVDALRCLAERVLEGAPPNRCRCDALVALRAVGAPASCFDRLWTIALDAARTRERIDAWHRRSWRYAAQVASEVLGHAGPSQELDARIVQELSAGLEQLDFERAEVLVRIAVTRKDATGLEPLVERALALSAAELASQQSAAALRLAMRCAEFVHSRDAQAPARLLGWLGDPEDPLFTPALHQVKLGCDWAVPALFAALESNAGDGAVAARAATRLFYVEAIDVHDPRLDAVLEHAPLRDGIELAGTMFYFGAPIERISHTVLEALCSPDEDTAQAGVLAVSCSRQPLAIWSEALQRGVHASVRDHALRQARLPSEVEQYWQDEIGENDVHQDEGPHADP